MNWSPHYTLPVYRHTRTDMHKKMQQSQLRTSTKGQAIFRALGAQIEELYTAPHPWDHLPIPTTLDPRRASAENDHECRDHKVLPHYTKWCRRQTRAPLQSTQILLYQ